MVIIERRLNMERVTDKTEDFYSCYSTGVHK